MNSQRRRFSFPAVAAAIIAIVLLSVIASHAVASSDGRVESASRRSGAK